MSTTVTSFYWSYDKGRMFLNVRTIYRKVSLTSGAPFAFFIYNIFLNVVVEYVWSTKNFLLTFLLRVTRHHGHIASFNKKKEGQTYPKSWQAEKSTTP